MADNIKVEEILKKYLITTREQEHRDLKTAIKEIVEAVVDKCAEEGKIKSQEFGDGDQVLDRQSILQVKQMVEY